MIAQEGRDVPGAPGCLPSPLQRLLLQAACLPSATARGAWEEWRRHHDLRSIDPVSARILPWIYHRHAELNIRESDVRLLEPIYRFAWLKNQRLLNSAEAVVLMLTAEGIETVLLKGLPLLIDAYRDEGGRYMEDFDLLLRADQVERAVTVMAGSRWNPLKPGAFSESSRRWRHSNELVHESGLQCDIHWRLLRRPYQPVSEAPVWIAKRTFVLRSTTTYAPDLAHTLLHLMVHGMSWQRVPPIRWILDMHLLIRRHAPDWGAILGEASRRGVVPAVREALTVYASILPGEIPEQFIRSAHEIPTSAQQELAFEQIAGPYHKARARVRWAIYRSSLAEAQTLGKIPCGFRGAATHFWNYWLLRKSRTLKQSRSD